MENGEGKNRFWKGVLVGALVMAFAGLILVGLSAGIFLIGRTVMGDQTQMAGGDSEDGGLDMDRVSAKMRYIQDIIDRYFLFEEDPEAVEDGIYTGLMYGLGDPYSVYYNEENYASLLEDTSGEYCGIGAMVQQDLTTGIMTVVKVFEGSPALEAGMLPGDVLYEVDGENVTGRELDLVVNENIRGEEGTQVTVTVLRGETAEEVELTMERRQVEVTTVESQMLDEKTGYIYVMQFEMVTGGQFKEAVDRLEDQGMEQLIVDLRGNPGGVLDAAVEMLAYILPEDRMDGMLIYTADKDGKGDRYFCRDGKIVMESDSGYVTAGYPMEDGHQLDLPLAVLVNGSSASAAEVFTGAVMDYDAGIVVGTQTFGKGIVQSLIPFTDGSAIKTTTAKYYTPSGRCIHGTGIEPDIAVELDEGLEQETSIPHEQDNQLQKAIETVKELG